MKNKLLFLLLSGLSFIQAGVCQTKNTYTDISYIKLSDSVLIDNINKVVSIEENNKDDSLFKKGLGYVKVYIEKYPRNDTIIVYYLNTQLIGLRKESIDLAYPDYYSFVNNRLVFVKIPALDKLSAREFSEKSKKHLRKLVDNCLEKEKKVTFRDAATGKKSFTDRHYRLDYIRFHDGYFLYIFKNKPPALVKET